MKIAAVIAVLVTVCLLSGADSTAHRFGGDRVELPPLSLAESLAQSASKMPSTGSNPVPTMDPSGDAFSGKLLPRKLPELPSRQLGRGSSAPRNSGMPVITPRTTVDFTLSIIPPPQNLDSKIVVKEPAVVGRPVPQR